MHRNSLPRTVWDRTRSTRLLSCRIVFHEDVQYCILLGYCLPGVICMYIKETIGWCRLPHVHRVFSVEVNLLECGWNSSKRVEVVWVGSSQRLCHVPRVNKHRLTTRDAVVEAHAVHKLDSWGRFIVSQVHVEVQFCIWVGNVDGFRVRHDVPNLTVDGMLYGCHQLSNHAHYGGFRWNTSQQHNADLCDHL